MKFLKQSYFFLKNESSIKKSLLLKLKTFKCPFLTESKHGKQYLRKIIFGAFLKLSRFIFVLKNLRCFEVTKKKYWSLKKTGTNYKKKIVYTDNPMKINGTKKMPSWRTKLKQVEVWHAWSWFRLSWYLVMTCLSLD